MFKKFEYVFEFENFFEENFLPHLFVPKNYLLRQFSFLRHWKKQVNSTQISIYSETFFLEENSLFDTFNRVWLKVTAWLKVLFSNDKKTWSYMYEIACRIFNNKIKNINIFCKLKSNNTLQLIQIKHFYLWLLS